MKRLATWLGMAAMGVGANLWAGEACQAEVNIGPEVSHHPSVHACVSKDGNVLAFGIKPNDVPLREGYKLCNGLNGSAYIDLGLNENGNFWEAGFQANGVISQPGGPKTFPLTIERTTTDNDFKVTQTFSVDPAKGPLLTVNMTVENLGAPKPVYLFRLFDRNPGQPVLTSQTPESIFSWGNGSPLGLMLTQPPSGQLELREFRVKKPLQVFGCADDNDSSYLPGSSPHPAMAQGRRYFGQMATGAKQTTTFEYRMF